MAFGPPPVYTFPMDAPPDKTPAPMPPTAHQSWSCSVLGIAVVLILSVNAVIFLKSCASVPAKTLDKAGQVIDKTGQALANIAAAFKQGTFSTTFTSYATTISNQTRLQVATLKQTEIITQTNQSSTAWGYVPLPNVVVEARAPVEYTYYLDLNAPWTFDLRAGHLIATAPPLHFNKPAVDASAIHYEVRQGTFKTADALDGLKRSVTSLVTIRAKENIPLVREHARQQTTEFIERWLMKNFSDATNYPVKVIFANEKKQEGLLAVPPSLERNSLSK